MNNKTTTGNNLKDKSTGYIHKTTTFIGSKFNNKVNIEKLENLVNSKINTI